MYEQLHKTILMVQSKSFHLARWYKYVQIQSFFWSVFSPNATKKGPEKTTYLDTFHEVLQVVTMCLPSNKSLEEITRSIIDLATSIKNEKYDFSISNIIIPADHKKLEEGCEVYNFLGNWVTFKVSLAFPEK